MLSRRTRHWIDLVCHVVFLVPFVFLMAWLSWPFFLRSFLSGEGSQNAGGLTLWPAKSLVLAGFLLLCAQAVSEIIKRVAVIRGVIADDIPEHELPPEVEAELEMERPGTDGAPRRD